MGGSMEGVSHSGYIISHLGQLHSLLDRNHEVLQLPTLAILPDWIDS